MTASNPKSAPALRPPQFGLRTLMLLVTGCALLLALNQWLSPIAIAGLAFLALSIFCHVAGNAIGTRLRAIGDRADAPVDDASRSSRRPQAHDYAPATQLSQRRSLGWIIVVATAVGIICGGIGGGLWTLFSSRGPLDPANIAIGVIAFATLGGLGSFLVFALIQVLHGALRQALHSTSRESLTHPLTPDS